MIPLFLRLVIEDDEEKRGINIWLPLILVWVLLSPLLAVILVVWSVSALTARLSSAPCRVEKLIRAAAVLMWHISGLRVNIRSRKSRVILHF